MPNSISDLGKQSRLRFEAETRLKDGTAPTSKGWTLNEETLGLLFKLASDPGQAGAALKLLHELQTFQVEMDLQYEQLEFNERELCDSLDYYKDLYNYAPVGYLVVNHDNRIIESNLAGARLLGVTREKLDNTTIDIHLAAKSRPAINTLVEKLRNDRTSASCAVQTAVRDEQPRLLRITVDISPDGQAILMVISE
ncbi:MAG: PAS domain-containing protein [Pseudohongiellaceae bacterium]